MLLTLTTTHRPATDLGYLLHKHPERVQSFPVPFGEAHVLYPEAAEDRCTAALVLDIDPVGLVRRRAGGGFALAEYVNDRPYVASSFLSVALVTVFKSAMAGTCEARPDLAASAIPLEAALPAVPARGGEGLVRRLFEPLGYDVEAEPLALDPAFPGWGAGRHLALRLAGEVRLADMLSHLYVLLPVLDDEKHYWVGDDEIEKLMRRGEGWLPTHPERTLIVRRYVKHQAALFHPALARLEAEDADEEAEAEDAAGPAGETVTPTGEPAAKEAREAAPAGGTAAKEAREAAPAGGTAAKEAGEAAPAGGTAAKTAAGGGRAAAGEEALEERVSLRDQRLGTVQAVLKASGASRVLDLGCGAGALLERLLRDGYAEIVGADVSIRALEHAARRLRLERLSEAQRARIKLIQSPLTYRDRRLAGYDAAALVEVIEHLDPPRLAAAERSVFGYARPGTVVVTTPNREYNVRWETLPAGRFRHPDHRFEWTRAEFADWAQAVAARHAYRVRYLPVGPQDAEVGPPTQMAVFEQ